MNIPNASTPLAYTLDGLAKAAGLGRTTVFNAVRVGDLKTKTPVVDGKALKRKLVTPEEAQRWLASFPDSRDI